MAKLLHIMQHAPAAVPAAVAVVDSSEVNADAAAAGSSSAGVSLAIVDGVDVVQVKLFAGIQPPSESY
jgi:ethanolamine utilization microcompartment shell protein EutL